MACLPAKTLETNEYNFSQLEFVKSEPLCADGLGYLNRKFDSGDAYEGGGAPLVSAPLSMLRESDSIEDAWLACPHLPPYADVRPVVPGDFLNRKGESYPDGLNHYCAIGRCQGTKKDGKPCDYKCMLQNAYLPLTRVRLANGEIFKFKSWTNPVACRNQNDVMRAAEGQVEGKRGWHKFWFAVHHLRAHISGQQQVGQDHQLRAVGKLAQR